MRFQEDVEGRYELLEFSSLVLEDATRLLSKYGEAHSLRSLDSLQFAFFTAYRQPEHCGGVSEAAKGIWMRREAIHVNRVIEYALKINVGAVIRRLGYIMELYGIGSEADRKPLLDHLTDTYVRLDPVLPAEGKFIRRWRLQLNLPADELLSVVKT